MKITILDDIISTGYQNHIQDIFFNQKFPWFFTPVISTTEGGVPNSGLTHIIYENNEKSPYFDLVLPILFEGLYEYNSCCELKELYRIRAGMFVRNQNNTKVHEKHIDLPHMKHYVMIYYIKDSDGPTCLYDGEEIIEKVEPKKGRCVLFPGEIYHASTCPRLNSNRMVLNYNFLT